jgi:tetratricopeptide (TPR) repeat protein
LERWDEAVEVYETAIGLRSDGAEVYHNLGDALLKLQRWEDAVAAYQKAIELNPEFSWSYNNLGDGLRELQRWDEAAQAYQKAIELKPDFALSHHNLGDVLVKKEDWENAIAAYQKAVDLDPNFVWSHYNLGDVLVKKEDWENAIAAYRNVIKLDPNLPQVHEKLGDALQHQIQNYSEEISQVYHRAVADNPTDLQAYYKALEVNPKDAEISLKLADILKNQGKLEQAVTFYKSTLQIEPNHPEIQAVAWYRLGDVLQDLRKKDEAINAYRKSLDLKHDFHTEEKLAILLRANLWQEKQKLGIQLEQERKSEEAAILYRRAITLKSDPLQFYYEALETNPDNYLLYFNLGNALFKKGMINHAIVFYKRGLQLKPNHLEMNLQLGKLLAEQNKSERATVYFNRAVEIDPECFEGHYRLAEAQEKIGQTPSCRFRLSEDQDIIELTEKTIWVTLSVQPSTSYYLVGQSSSPQSPTNSQALIQVEFLDNNQQLIPKPYSGIQTSETVGPYFYISTSGENLSEFKTKVFKTTSLTNYVRLGCRNWHNKKLIILDSRVELSFDSAPYLEAAIVSYQKALKINPHDYILINRLGDLLEKQGRLGEALSCYRQVLEVSYNSSYKVNNQPNRVFNNRVLLPLHSSLPYQQTGYTIRSQSILKSLQEKGIDVLATTRLGYPDDFLPLHKSQSVPEIEKIDGVDYFRLKSEQKQTNIEQNYAYIENYAEQLATVARTHNASVIHSASNFVTGMAGVLAARKVGIKSVYEVRGFWHLSKVAKMPNLRDSCWLTHCQLMESAVARQVDAVVTLSQVMKEELINWGVDESRITVIPNAVDTNKFKPHSSDQGLQKKLGLDGWFVVSFIGSLNEYEGVDLLIQAIGGLIAQGTKIKLLIVGDGSAKQGLENWVDSINMKQHIIFAGQVPFSEVINYYALSDVCVFPRKAEEVCQSVPPLKLLEPMAMAKPVIVSALPPLLEMVRHEETGLVCRSDHVGSLQNAILRIYENSDLGDRLGKAAMNWVQANRQWSMVCQKYLEVYQRLFTLA